MFGEAQSAYRAGRPVDADHDPSRFGISPASGYDDHRAVGVLDTALADRAQHRTGDTATSAGTHDQQRISARLADQFSDGVTVQNLGSHSDIARVCAFNYCADTGCDVLQQAVTELGHRVQRREPLDLHRRAVRMPYVDGTHR